MKKRFKKLMREQVFRQAESGQFFSPSSLPERIESIRKALGFSQRQMAKRLGMSHPAYLITVRKLDSSGLKTVQKFLEKLNATLELRIGPKKPYSVFVRERAQEKAKQLLDRTYGNMAMEKQSPGKKTYEKRLKELADEMEAEPAHILWED